MNNFSKIIGQDAAVEHLKRALQTGSVSHAYIFKGEEGTGKKMLAYTFAAALQCTSEEGDRPCGQCISCMQAEDFNHPDIITITHKPKYSGDKSTALGVDDIRAMRADVMIRPYSSEKKIYIVPNAETMTVQAQNALLKTIEEPPAYAVILLLADGIDNFLPTVKSRCITLPIRQVPDRLVEEYLIRERNIERDRAVFCARFARGNIGRALLLSESGEFIQMQSESIAMLRKLSSANAADIGDRVHEINESGRTGALLELMQIWFRDILVYKSTGSADGLIFSEELRYIREAAELLDDADMEDITRAMNKAERRLDTRVNADMTMQMLLLEIRECMLRRN